MGIGDVELGEDETHGPWVRDGCSACHEDDEGALTANEVDQELQEGVDGEGLVDVAEGIDPGGGLNRHETAPRGSGVDGHPGPLVGDGSGSSGGRHNIHEENAHDISLEQRLAVVLAGGGSVSVQVSSRYVQDQSLLTSATTQLWQVRQRASKAKHNRRLT